MFKVKMNYLLYIFITIYSLFIVYRASFGLIDDHIFLSTVFSGHSIPFFLSPEIGRFYPLDGQEYNLISFVSHSPVAFYLWNSLEYIIFAIVLFKIEEQLTGGSFRGRVYLFIIYVSFIGGMANLFLRLFVPERDALFFLTIALFFYIQFYYKSDRNWFYGILSLICANISLYYKEPMFILVGGFSFFHLLFDYKKGYKKINPLDVLWMLSSLIFLLIYYFVIFQNHDGSYYGQLTINKWIVHLKNSSLFFLTNPFILCLFIPFLIIRIYLLIRKRDRVNAMFDSMALSAAGYFLAIIVLNIYSPYYLMPLYLYAFFSVSYNLNIIKKIYPKLFFSCLGGFLFLAIFSAIPFGIHQFSVWKNVPNNFQQTVSFLKKYLDGKPVRVGIFLYGVNRNTGVEVYNSFGEFMQSENISTKKYDLKTDEVDNNILRKAKVYNSSPYSVFHQLKPQKITQEDLVVVGNFSQKEFNPKSFDAHYRLLFKSKSPIFNFGDYSLKSIVKYGVNKVIGKNNFVSDNIFNLPINFYVYKKIN
ncbi:hypothetical protein [Celerinatantimonas yamalensis]|uniref:Dolichyl-phosphate-mannose-protein mannosyltransferase n=1 Tax=Celerinatantimonas yamalensis TaxID=559956 RepID=A0ABW9G622_9GAMM